MAILNSNASKSIHGRLQYIFATSPHSQKLVKHRNLAVYGNNISMITEDDGSVSRYQNGYYLERQFKRVLNKAQNPQRQYQMQSIIISFSNSEFNLKDKSIDQQEKIVDQAMAIIKGFALKYFKYAQFIIAIQSDGKGGMLHAHLLINAIKPNGKAVRTNLFSVYAFRKRLNDYLEASFSDVTGRKWISILEVRDDIDEIFTRAKWISVLQDIINDAKKRSITFSQFKMKLIRHHVGLRKTGNGFIYTFKFNGRKHEINDFKQYKDKDGNVISTHGLGKAYSIEQLKKFFKKRRNKKKE